MAFVPKNWVDDPSTSTPISAAALEDLEQRVYNAAIADANAAIAAHQSDSTAVHGITDTSLLGVRPTLVTALPGSPTDGQVIYFQSSGMATLGLVWQFRYRSAASGSFKWEYIGGSEWWDEIATSENVTGTSFADISTVGPSITLPLAGDYLLSYSATLQSPTSSGSAVFASPRIGSTAASDNDAIAVQTPAAAATAASGARQVRKTGLAASDVLKLQYRVSTGTGVAVRRTLSVRPIRVG